MLGDIAEEVTGELTERWGAVVAPSVLYWAAGFAIWDLRTNWSSLTKVSGWNGVQQLALGIAIATLVLGSAALVWSLENSVLRALEGYWPGWTGPLQARLRRRKTLRIQEQDHRLRTLVGPNGTNTSPEASRLYSWLRRVPVEEADRMPTRLGDILRAAELWPYRKYGLDSVICWPRLWLVMPADARAVIEESRNSLNIGVRLIIWSVLFAVWTPWLYHAAAIAAIGTWMSYRWSLRSASVYGDLIEAAFDVHRAELYLALRLPPPPDAAAEQAAGEQLTAYLHYGSDDSNLKFGQS